MEAARAARTLADHRPLLFASDTRFGLPVVQLLIYRDADGEVEALIRTRLDSEWHRLRHVPDPPPPED